MEQQRRRQHQPLLSFSVALLAAALLLLFPVASGAVINAAADKTAIQTALDSANPGDTVVVAAGQVNVGDTPLTIPKPGVSLRGAGIGNTTFQSYDNMQYLLHVTGSVP
jgi:hypothetical protein